MKKLKLYLDSNVIGKLDDHDNPSDMAIAKRLLNKIKRDKYDVVISEITLTEVNNILDPIKKKTLTDYFKEINYESIFLSDEVERITSLVKKNGLITSDKQINDRYHIGYALVSRADVLVSMNFNHLVNIKTIRGVKGIAAVEGYHSIDIMPPVMVIGMGGKKK